MSKLKANAGQKTPRALGFRMPAEWEPQAAVWLAWPHHRTDWPVKKAAIYWTFAEIARLISEVERVRFLVADRRERSHATKVLGLSGVDLAQIDFVEAPTNRSWTRDSLPSFVVKGRGKQREVGAVKFRFDGWGRYRDHLLDDAAGIQVAERMLHHWLPTSEVKGKPQRVVLEGGSIDVDGEGTILTTERCLLHGEHSRNAWLDRQGTEQVLSDFLGVSKVLWLPDGIAGDDTSGHVDDFCRFVAPGKLVMCEEKNRRHHNHKPLSEARARLEGQTDAKGRKLEIIGLPMPRDVRYGDLILPASYANFLFVNGRVLVPTFNDPNDYLALGILREVLPKHEVVGVYCRDLVLGLGTIHCSSQQEPAGH
ncbi:MAG: agmatine deiminase family protein [Myxococcales bacterium]|nr:agmatine deiminase family protein [Myxococcales bacterium]